MSSDLKTAQYCVKEAKQGNDEIHNICIALEIILSKLEGGLTPRAADGLSADEIAQVRRIARDVVSGGGE